MASASKGSVPSWMDEFTDFVGTCFELGQFPMSYDVWAPEGYEEDEDSDEPWLVHFYPPLSELAGGPQDGTLVHRGIMLDVLSVFEFFDEVESLFWTNSFSRPDPRYGAAMLHITGLYQGNSIDLEVFDAPPDDATVDMVVEHWSGCLRIKGAAGSQESETK